MIFLSITVILFAAIGVEFERIISTLTYFVNAKEVFTDKEQFCYDDLGCFNNSFPWTTFPTKLSSIPISPEKIAVEMLFYKNKSLSVFNEEVFDPNLPTIIGIHGWSPLLKRTSRKYVPKHIIFIADIFNAIQEKMDGNFIIVNWKKGSSTLNYPQSCSNIRVIGRQIAISLDKIENLDIENVHIIGHSLGAHMAGYIGKELHLGRITGLDPAGPAFTFPSMWYDEFPNELEKTHLWYSDAEFVDVIHSDAGTFGGGHYGLSKPIGHIDFYPSMGRDQPFCNIYRYHNRLIEIIQFNRLAFCDHRLSKVYFIDSIKRPNLYQFCNETICNTLGFSATKQSSRQTFYIPENNLPKFNKRN
uniref:Triacylglycerol lipase-like protein n=1 Tax=Oikopleura dioica TaxID=34765 RepID=Q676A9_OIKDI|nr:triacylglycerol lipase-like protein [Oikopleura dioica]